MHKLVYYGNQTNRCIFCTENGPTILTNDKQALACIYKLLQCLCYTGVWHRVVHKCDCVQHDLYTDNNRNTC